MCRGKDLISRLLVVDPRLRLTVGQALSHAWFRGSGGADVVLAGALENMRAFGLRMRVAATGVVAVGRISATLSRISDGLQGARSTADSALPRGASGGSTRPRGTGSIVPTLSVPDASSAASAGSGGAHTWEKQLVLEGGCGRVDVGLDTVAEGDSRNISAAGAAPDGPAW